MVIEYLKPILKAVAAFVAAYIAQAAADWLGAEIDATSLATMINSVFVALVVWAVPNIQRERSEVDTMIDELSGD